MASFIFNLINPVGLCCDGVLVISRQCYAMTVRCCKDVVIIQFSTFFYPNHALSCADMY